MTALVQKVFVKAFSHSARRAVEARRAIAPGGFQCLPVTEVDAARAAFTFLV